MTLVSGPGTFLLMLAPANWLIDNDTMSKHDQMHELKRELDGIEDRAFALSVYDLPENMEMSDLIVFALAVYDTPERAVDAELLKEVFVKCGKFGVVAIEGAIMDTPPYVHLGKYGDSIEKLQNTGIVTVDETMRFTRTGSQIGAALFTKIRVGEHQPQ